MKKLFCIFLLSGCAQTVPMDPHQCYFDPQYHAYIHHDGCVEHTEFSPDKGRVSRSHRR
jgi:hypothetical protein